MNTSYAEKVNARAAAFEEIWNSDIDAVFSDVAAVYDKENDYASMGLLKGIRRRLIATIDVQPGQPVLDVCAMSTSVPALDGATRMIDPLQSYPLTPNRVRIGIRGETLITRTSMEGRSSPRYPMERQRY